MLTRLRPRAVVLSILVAPVVVYMRLVHWLTGCSWSFEASSAPIPRRFWPLFPASIKVAEQPPC